MSIRAGVRSLKKKPAVKKCPAILGLIKEAEEIAAENKKSPTINATLIFAAQKAEHYEIASYGGLRDWAKLLGNEAAVNILEQILGEEKAADSKLTEPAESECNESAQNNENEDELAGASRSPRGLGR